jgi:hypothetical protein
MASRLISLLFGISNLLLAVAQPLTHDNIQKNIQQTGPSSLTINSNLVQTSMAESTNSPRVNSFPANINSTVHRALDMKNPNIFSFTGSDQYVMVPVGGPSQAHIFMWGGGGETFTDTKVPRNYHGGSGAYVEGILDILPGEWLTIVVGGGGGFDYGGGGRCGDGKVCLIGGGRSAIQRNGVDIVTAGGGGGGGINSSGGSATSVLNGVIETTSYQTDNAAMSTACSGCLSGGGSATSSGCGSNGSSQYQGGSIGFNNCDGCGTGGGGYFGGGASKCGKMGGGGGSSYLKNLVSYSLSQSGPIDGACAGQYSIFYDSASCGGGIQGQNGRIVIQLGGFSPSTVSHNIAPSSTTASNLPSQPSNLSSTEPSCFPTLAPTLFENCPAGYYLIMDPGMQHCQRCPAGYVSLGGTSMSCTICPAGSYGTPNASSCSICPFNTYQPDAGQQSCISCSSGYLTGAPGSTSNSQCVDPISSVIVGFIFTAITIVVIGPYLFNGRLQRIAFARKERLVKKLIIIAGATSKASDLLSAVNHSLVSIKKANQKKRFFSDSQWDQIKWVFFILLAGLITFVSIILTIFFGMSQILFNVLLLYRNFRIYLPSLKSFEDIVDDTVDAVVNLLNMRYLKDLAFPFIYLINAVSDLHINLSTVQVSCSGAQAPGLLLINIIIVGVVIIIIRSDIQSYWAVAQTKLLFKVFYLPLNNSFAGKNKLATTFYVSCAMLMFLLPTPCKVIQYSMSLVTAATFFDENGRSRSNVNCDSNISAFNFPLDSFLAIITTLIVYVVLFPIIYMMSQVIVPSFKLGEGQYPIMQALMQCWKRLCPGIFREDERQNVVADVEQQSKEIEMAEKMPPRASTDSIASSVLGEYVKKRQSSRFSVKTETSEVIVVENIECHSRAFSAIAQFTSVVFSIDWLYMKFISIIITSIFESYRQFLKRDHFKSLIHYVDVSKYGEDYEKIQTTRIQMNEATLPYIPWFLAVEDAFKTKHELAIDHFEENQMWKTEQLRFPNFAVASNEVRKDMNDVIEQVFDALGTAQCLKPFVLYMVRPASYVIIFQLMTDVGRAVWKRVIMNYLSVITLSFGCWLDYMVNDFDIFADYERFTQLLTTIERNTTEKTSRLSTSVRLTTLTNGESDSILKYDDADGIKSNNNNCGMEDDTRRQRLFFQDKGEALVKIANDPKLLFQHYLASIVQVRVVLLQIVPAFTFWSIIAVDLASCPIFVFSEDVNNAMTPFIFRNPWKVANDLLTEDATASGLQTVETWKIAALSYYLFIQRSRFVQFCFILLNTTTALIIVLGKSEAVKIGLLILVLIEFFVVGLAFSFQALLLLHKFLFPVKTQYDSSNNVSDNKLTEVANPVLPTKE